MDGSFRLRRHRLPHLAELRVDQSLVERRFARECDTRHCDATCCQVGVWVDAGQRDLILAHAARVQGAMDPEQEHDPTRWFDESEVLTIGVGGAMLFFAPRCGPIRPA